MGKPLMIQLEDDQQIEALKKKTGAKTKIEVIRVALRLLEEQVAREKRIERWKKAAKIIGSSSVDIHNDFKTSARFKKLP